VLPSLADWDTDYGGGLKKFILLYDTGFLAYQNCEIKTVYY